MNKCKETDDDSEGIGWTISDVVNKNRVAK